MPAVTKPLVDVSAQAAYPATPQIEFTFNPSSILLSLEDDPSVLKGCMFSFDGVNDAGVLITGCPLASKEYKIPYRKIYFKRYTAVGAQKIRVEIE